MEAIKGAHVSSVKAGEWEPFVVEGHNVGEVHWLRQTHGEGGVLFAGLWRHTPEEHPDGMPYKVAGSETFTVIEGEAELRTAEGDTIRLEEGVVVSFEDGFEATWRTIRPFTKFFVVA